MSIWNKVLLGLIFVLSLGFFYMAAQTLKMHQVWRTSAQQYEEAIAQAQEEADQLKNGVLEGLQVKKAGVRQLKDALDREVFMRGRVWRGVQPASRPTQQDPEGQFELMVDLQNEGHQITDQMTVYLFEEKLARDGGQYLGEFRVSGLGGTQITLKPAKRMNDQEYNRLTKSAGPWMLYERLPMDRHDLFDGVPEEELKAMLPEAAYREILKHGKPADPDDPPERVVNGKYQRPLVDFALALGYAHIRWSEWIDQIKSIQRDLEAVKTALALAEARQKLHGQEKADVQKELADMEAQRDAVAAHLKEVEEALAARYTMIQQTVEKIQNLARQIARFQLEATRRIDERTRAALQSRAETTPP